MIKRQKLDSPVPTGRVRQASKVFSPFRTLGIVTNSVPFSVTSLGQSFVVTTVVGRSFQVYDASSLHLLFVSQPQTESPIQCVHSHSHHTFAAWGSMLGLYKRARLVTKLDVPNSEVILKIHVFGDFVCLATASEIYIYKWDLKEDVQLYTTLKMPAALGKVVDLMHMPTYLNKIVVATENAVSLFNVKTGKLLYTFEDVPEGIAFVEPAPVALDVLAVVTRAGTISMFNLRTAKTVLALRIGEPVTSLSFRTDNPNMMGIGSTNGDLFFYDLTLRRRVHSVRGLHSEPVSKLQFLAGQPIVISTAGDNSLVEMVFDPSLANSNSAISTPPRILRRRGGHSKNPTVLSFTDEESHFILSAGLDQDLWSFSLRKDSQSHLFSQRATSKKLKTMSKMGQELDKFPQIIDLAFQAAKQREWDNILTAHKGESFARTWNGKRGIVGAHHLATLDKSFAKSVGISPCGNFAFVGSAKGSVAVYNIQSGLIRKRLLKAHSQEVTGVFCDATNSVIITSSLDGTVKFHDFHTERQLACLDLDAGVTALRYHANSGLVAAVVDSMAIIVIDIRTQKVVRQLWGHGNRITTLDFTPDGRWIISAALDNTIRTWDIPTGGCIDAVRVSSPAVALRVSPTMEWLATAHVNGVGIQLWAMRSQFHTISTRHISESDVKDIVMPNSAGEGGVSIIDGALDEEESEIDIDLEHYDPPAQISTKLETYSHQPQVKFTTLVHLDAIRQRNKPVEAPKAPEKTSFFLGVPKEVEEEQMQEVELSGPTNGVHESDFTRMLRTGELEALVEHLAKLGPAATDLELRSLDTRAPYDEVVAFMDAMTGELEHRRNFELVQAWVNMLLRIHGDIFAAPSPELEASFEKWRVVQSSEVARIQDNTRFCSGVMAYLRNL